MARYSKNKKGGGTKMGERKSVSWDTIRILEDRLNSLYKIHNRLLKSGLKDKSVTQSIKELQSLIETLSYDYDD